MSQARFIGTGNTTGKSRVPIRRALSQTDITGKVTQVLQDPILEDLIRVNNPIWANVPRKPGEGPQAQIGSRSARGTASFVDDTDTPTEQESTYDTPTTFPFKTLLYNGKVTRRAEAISRNYINLYAEEVESGVQEIKDVWENEVLNGDITVNSKGFDGMRKLTPSGQIVYMGTNGAQLSLAKLDETIDACWGKPSFAIATQRGLRSLNGLLQAQQRFNDRTVVDGGFRVPVYNDIPLFWSQWLSDAQTRGSASTCTSFEFFNTSKVYAEDLTPLFRMPLARVSSQYESFDLGIDTVLVVRNGKYISSLRGILP